MLILLGAVVRGCTGGADERSQFVQPVNAPSALEEQLGLSSTTAECLHERTDGRYQEVVERMYSAPNDPESIIAADLMYGCFTDAEAARLYPEIFAFYPPSAQRCVEDAMGWGAFVEDVRRTVEDPGHPLADEWVVCLEPEPTPIPTVTPTPRPTPTPTARSEPTPTVGLAPTPTLPQPAATVGRVFPPTTPQPTPTPYPWTAAQVQARECLLSRPCSGFWGGRVHKSPVLREAARTGEPARYWIHSTLGSVARAAVTEALPVLSRWTGVEWEESDVPEARYAGMHTRRRIGHRMTPWG